jgi:hypothetical protein
LTSRATTSCAGLGTRRVTGTSAALRIARRSGTR